MNRGNKPKRTFRPELECLETREVPALVVPALSSLPGANHTIYLDFDGHTTTGTAWNSYFNDAVIQNQAYDIDGNPSSFSSTELARIVEAFNRVAEDFIPFNVNVTTVDPGVEALRKTGSTDTQWGVRVVITKNTEGIGTGGGIAFVSSFNWNTDTPAFVYTTTGKTMGEAISHEVGHTLGLAHDGKGTMEYYQGHGSGETGWAPIMGNSYYRNVTQWDNGGYAGSNNAGTNANYGKGKDDLAVITTYNGFGYRSDDHGQSMTLATPLTVSGTSVSGKGIIEKNTDTDLFSFTTGGGFITIKVKPFTPGPNLDVRADIFDSTGRLVATSNPSTTLTASFSLNLPAGKYFLRIDGVGRPATSSTDPGYSGHGSLGRYTITGNIPAAATSSTQSEQTNQGGPQQPAFEPKWSASTPSPALKPKSYPLSPGVPGSKQDKKIVDMVFSSWAEDNQEESDILDDPFNLDNSFFTDLLKVNGYGKRIRFSK